MTITNPLKGYIDEMPGNFREYFQRLYERLDLAVKVPFREVKLENWTPEMNKCHDNVDHWIRHSVGSRAIRGWIFWPPDETGKCRFFAHSVIEENGLLVDITPIDSNTPREILRFLTHTESETDFDSIRAGHAEMLYPPVTFSEWCEYQQSASSDSSTSE